MTPSISVHDKKEFIKWFIRNYHFKRREARWILEYCVGKDDLIENIRFVEDAHFCSKALIMSTMDSDGIPLRFYKGNVMTGDAEVAFNDLRYNRDEELYIQINFPNKNQCAEYIGILEENPNVPSYAKKSSEDERIAVEFLEAMSKEFQRNGYMKQIDAALDRGDKRAFIELSEMLRTVNVSKQSMEVN